MYPTTMNYRSILDEGNISAWWYGTVTLKDGTTKTFDMSDISDSSGSLNLKCSENSEIGIGTAYAAEFCVQFKNSLGISRYKLFDGIIDLHARITQRINIATWADAAAFTWQELSTAKWGSLDEFSIDFEFPMGVFIIQEVMQSAGDAKIRAYDFMLKAGKELPAAMSTQKKIPYDWLALACTSCSITLGITRAETLRMPNGNRLLAFSNANNNVKTWRDVIAQAAAVLGANAMMDRSGQLTLRRYGKYAVDGVASGFRYSSDFSDYQSYYTGIYLSYKEDGIQDYQTNAASTAQDTGLAYDLGYNAFLQISDEDARHRAMKEIINAQKDLAYVPFKVSMPFNPAYDLMDVIEFYENQAADHDLAPITAITFRIGGKMDISCGGENPALQEAQSKEAKALETASSAGLNDFWIVIDNAPEEASVEIPANTATKIGEVLFYAKEALSTFEINYTATYSLLKTSLVEAEILVDDVSIYKTQENQWPEENRLTVTTGCKTDTAGSHKVEVYLTVKESSLDIGGGGVLYDLNVSENNEYVAQDYGVYGFRKATVLVPDGGNGYYGGAQDVSSQIERILVGSAYSDLEDQDYGTEAGLLSLPPIYDVSQGFIEYINPNRSALSFYLANWPYRMTDKFELVYKMISDPAQMGSWPTIIGTSAAADAKMYAQFNFWSGRTVMNLAYNGAWAGDGNMSYESPFDYENYYRLVGDAGTFTLYKGPTLNSIDTQCFQKVFTDGSGPSGFCMTLLPPGNTEKLDMNIYGLKVWNENGSLIHHYRPITDGLCDVVTSYAFMATTTGHINGPAVN